MATEFTTPLPHCDWVLIYDHGHSPPGAKTLDLQVPATAPAGGVELSEKNDGTGVFKAVANNFKGQVGIDASKDPYAHFTATSGSGTITITHYVH
jgi:hypothetical protein